MFKHGLIAERAQSTGTEAVRISLALFCQRDNALGDNLVHDLRLAGVVQGFTRLFIGVAQCLDRVSIERGRTKKIE